MKEKEYKTNREQGTIAIEATVSLTVFVYVIVMLLSVINICYLQARISVSLHAAAKEVSQLYYLHDIQETEHFKSALTKSNQDSEKMITNMGDDIITYMDEFSNAANRIHKEINGLTTNELREEEKDLFLQLIVKELVQKNLTSSNGDNPDDFLRRYHVINGLNGLNFQHTTLAYDQTNRICTGNKAKFVVTYKVKIIPFLNLDFTIKLSQSAITYVWGNCIYLNDSGDQNQSKSIWDMKDVLKRGKLIVSEEKKKLKYTSDSDGFHGYHNSDGANEFIKITSLNTNMESYQDIDAIKNRLSDEFNGLQKGVAMMDTEIIVKDTSGANVAIVSQQETRTYKLILVVPDNADRSIIDQAVREFVAFKKDVFVTIDIRTGYGRASS